MSNNKSQLATFRIEPELWESFKAQARKNGLTASDVLNDFVQTYVAGGSAIAPTEAPQLDNLDSRIDDKIAPLRAELEEIKAALVKQPGKSRKVA